MLTEEDSPESKIKHSFVWIKLLLPILLIVIICLLLLQLLVVNAENNQNKYKISQLKEQQQQLILQQNQQLQQISLLNAKFDGISGQAKILEDLYNKIADNSDARKLIEIENSINLAAQQLIVAEKNSVAIKLLNIALNQAKTFNHPRFVPLQKAIQEDIKQIENLPADLQLTQSQQLQDLFDLIDKLPLAMSIDSINQTEKKFALKNNKTKSKIETKEFNTNKLNWWEEKFAQIHSIWQNFTFSGREYFKIKEINTNLPLIITPDQAFFLKENVKLHIVSARLSILTNNWQNAKNELDLAASWLNNFFEHNNDVNNAKQLIISIINDLESKASSSNKTVNLTKSINAINQLNRYFSN